MGNKLLIFSFLCCIGSYLEKKSTIQHTNIINGQTLHEKQGIEINHVSFEEKIKDFIKLHANIVDKKEKKYYEMTVFELADFLKGYKAPKNLCNDELGCLIGVLLQKKYDDIVSCGQNFAASFGFNLDEYQIIILIVCALWAFKILAGFVY